MIDPRPWMLV
jgi:hypothetical protein